MWLVGKYSKKGKLFLVTHIMLQLTDHFGIDRNHDDVGLLFRIWEKNYNFVCKIADLNNDSLYFLYFKDTSDDRKVSLSSFWISVVSKEKADSHWRDRCTCRCNFLWRFLPRKLHTKGEAAQERPKAVDVPLCLVLEGVYRDWKPKDAYAYPYRWASL